MKAALYARVSTRDKGQNPEVQLDPLRKYCDSMQWEIFREYPDKASAADLAGRKEWAQLMKDASLHKFDILLIWKLDRAFRSMDHASTTLNMLNSYKVGFRSLMDPAIDTTTPNGQLLFNILAAVAQFEKDLATVRINEGISYAKAHGTKSGLPIGRQPHDIDLEDIQKAIQECCKKGKSFTYSETARILSFKKGEDIKPGTVHLRIGREADQRKISREKLIAKLLTNEPMEDK